MLADSDGLPLTVFVMASSCVPPTHMSTSGATLDRADLVALGAHPRVLGLAEVMNFPGVIGGASDVLEKIIEIDPENEASYRDLEDVYIKEEAWDELVATYRRHASTHQDPAVTSELLRAMAGVLDEKLEDPKAAAETLQEAVETNPEDLDALVHLSSLLERLEQWVDLTEVLSRRVELTDAEVERVELHRRIGEIALEKMGDAEAAEERLTKALELDPENVGAMMALVSLYRSRNEWLRAATLLVDAEQATGSRMEKARLLFEAGEIHRRELDAMDKAVNLYAKALLADPEFWGALALALAGAYAGKKGAGAAAKAIVRAGTGSGLPPAGS